jgi:hypothetical protein
MRSIPACITPKRSTARLVVGGRCKVVSSLEAATSDPDHVGGV